MVLKMPLENVRIHDLPLEERPRERLIKRGPEHLGTGELLAIILRTGTKNENAVELANRLLKNYGLKGLSTADYQELRAVPGIKEAKACQLQACFELARRLEAYTAEPRPRIKSSKDVYNLLAPKMRDLKKERFIALYLNTKNALLRSETVSLGSLNGSFIHPREVFKTAILESAASVIIAHNHPSGDPNPSKEDEEVTQRLIKAGRLMGIKLLDHIIIGNKGFHSLLSKAPSP
jgi:DNA repair protein RadC